MADLLIEPPLNSDGLRTKRSYYAALANSIRIVGAKCRAEAELECGPIGGCGTSSASGQTEMLPHTPQHPPLEFETEAQLSQ
jgi:hypothetical protein